MGARAKLNCLFFCFLLLKPAVNFAQTTDLVISKSANISQVHSGQAFSYTITITNLGPDSAINCFFTDTLPRNVFNVSLFSCNGSGGGICPGMGMLTVSNLYFSGTIPVLPSNGSVEFIINLNAPSPPPTQNSFTNTARVFPATGTTDPNLTSNRSVTSTTILKVTDIEVVATASKDTINCGSLSDSVDYTIYWINKGLAAADSIRLSNSISSYVTSSIGTGNSTFQFDYQIKNIVWQASSINSQAPTATMTPLSGNSSSTTSTITGAGSYVLRWAAGDTITLRYRMVLNQLSTSGCGITRTFNMRNVSSFFYSGVNVTYTNLQDSITSNNSRNTDVVIYACPPDPCYRLDIEVLKTQSPTTSFSCLTTPQTINYSVKWINHGPHSADSIFLQDNIRNYGSYSGSGTAIYTMPYRISNFNWSSSSLNSIPPSTQFNLDTGNARSNSSSITTLQSGSYVPQWAAGDTITLEYSLTFYPITVTGCGRSYSFNIDNEARFTIPSITNIVDTFAGNNISSVQKTIGSCTATPCAVPDSIDIAVEKGFAGPDTLGCSDLPDTFIYEVMWINNGLHNAAGIALRDDIQRVSGVYNNYNVNGNTALYTYPYTIFNLSWSASSTNTIPPNNNFSPMSGNISSSTGTSNIATIYSTQVVDWAPGDTIFLRYAMRVNPPNVAGCGRSFNFTLRNMAYFTIPSTVLLADTVGYNNRDTILTRFENCSSIPCEFTDIMSFSRSEMISDPNCDIPVIIDYHTFWVNNGWADADSIRLRQNLTSGQTYTNTGNGNYYVPFTISNLVWRSSTSNTSVPTAQFSSMSGNSSSISTSLNINPTAIVQDWAVGDTVHLYYRLTINPYLFSGCGRQYRSIITAHTLFDNLRSQYLIDTFASNNNHYNRDTFFLRSTDLAISKNATPQVTYSGDTIQFEIIFQNAPGGMADPNARWFDTMPPEIQIIPSSITCSTLTGAATCGTISYDSISRVLSQVIPGMPTNSSVRVVFRGVLDSVPSQSIPLRVYAYTDCIDCVEASNYSQVNFQVDNTLLSVDYLYFRASKGLNHVLLNWATASESKNNGFEIQRLYKGLEWENIGYVSGNGTITDVNNYMFYDNNPQKINYYRLKQYDFEGNYQFSNVVEVDFINSNIKSFCSIYPNPTTNDVYLSVIENLISNPVITVYDNLGKVMSDIDVLNVSKNLFEIKLDKLKSGNYFIKVEIRDNHQLLKLTKF